MPRELSTISVPKLTSEHIDTAIAFFLCALHALLPMKAMRVTPMRTAKISSASARAAGFISCWISTSAADIMNSSA